jgi:hypothetical protein
MMRTKPYVEIKMRHTKAAGSSHHLSRDSSSADLSLGYRHQEENICRLSPSRWERPWYLAEDQKIKKTPNKYTSLPHTLAQEGLIIFMFMKIQTKPMNIWLLTN